MIPVLDSKIWRAVAIVPLRIKALFLYWVKKDDFPLYYKKLKANYETFWQSDSDACNDLDQLPVILWFLSRGHKCISNPTVRDIIFAKNQIVEIQIKEKNS